MNDKAHKVVLITVVIGIALFALFSEVFFHSHDNHEHEDGEYSHTE